MHDKWEKPQNPILFLRRCDSTSYNGNEGLENEMFQRAAKFIMSDFYGMDLMKGIAILVKVDDLCNTLKSLLATGRVCPAISICLLRPSFIKGRVLLLITISYDLFS